MGEDDPAEGVLGTQKEEGYQSQVPCSDFPGSPVVKTAFQCRGHEFSFDPWSASQDPTYLTAKKPSGMQSLRRMQHLGSHLCRTAECQGPLQSYRALNGRD